MSRGTHDFVADHHGALTDATVTLSIAVGTTPAGAQLTTLLQSLLSVVGGATALPPAFLPNPLTVSPSVERAMSRLDAFATYR